MDEYGRLEDARLQCFKTCRAEVEYPSNKDKMTQDQIYFYAVIHRKQCIRRCEEDLLGLLPSGGVSSHVLQQLEYKNGYNYLQVALYRVSGSVLVHTYICYN